MATLLEQGLFPSVTHFFHVCCKNSLTALFECYCRVQMSDLSSFQTTSFHTHLSFLVEENDESLLEDVGDDDEGNGEEYNKIGTSGRY